MSGEAKIKYKEDVPDNTGVTVDCFDANEGLVDFTKTQKNDNHNL